MTIFYRRAIASDAAAISGLIRSLSHYFLDDPSSPDCDAFLETIAPESVLERLVAPNYFYIVAESCDGICGVVAVRDGSHLYHLFVNARMHGQGIARELWNRAALASESSSFTVNSSLFAVPMYSHFGFIATGDRQTRNGVSFQPMEIRPGS